MEQLFHKAKQNRIFQDVVDQIQTAILDGEIEAGAKLPPERDLCELFQTSRGTLREALRILEQKSLIEIRLGVNGGAYVRDPNSELMAENLAMLIRSNEVSLEHLEEFREGIEGAVAGLAARRATIEDVRELQELVEEAAALRRDGLTRWNDFVRIDETIHMTIARIAGNPLYDFVLHSVHDNIHRYYDKFLAVGEQEMEENYQDLRLLVEAIAAHQPEQSTDLAREHVRRFSAYMINKRR
jgi:DNA-binding FadR family transcriptional regulator